MSKDKINRFIALGISIAAGLIVQFLVREPLLAIVSFMSLLLISLVIMSKGFPVIISSEARMRSMLGYEACYMNQEEASSSIISASNSTRRLDLMLIRGHIFIIDHNSLFDRMVRNNFNLKIRILLLKPDGIAMQSYLEKMNLQNHKKQEYLQKCSLVRSELDNLKTSTDLEYAFYDFFPSWKLIVTDSKVFVAAYDTKNRGSKLSIASYHDMSKPYFVAFSNYFDEIWKKFLTVNNSDRLFRK